MSKDNENDIELKNKYDELEREYKKLELLYKFKNIENEYLTECAKELQFVKKPFILYRLFKGVVIIYWFIRRILAKIYHFARRVAGKIKRMIRRVK